MSKRIIDRTKMSRQEWLSVYGVHFKAPKHKLVMDEYLANHPEPYTLDDFLKLRNEIARKFPEHNLNPHMRSRGDGNYSTFAPSKDDSDYYAPGDNNDSWD